ncbi:MAG: hypothetical protein ACOYO7_01880 [Phycisphaerales bacterium]
MSETRVPASIDAVRTLRASYALAAGAAAATAASADAGIVYSGAQDLAISQFSALNLNLDGDAYGDVLLKNYVFGGNYMGATVNFAPGKLVSFYAGLSYVSALSAGFSIDASSVGPSFFGSMAYGAANQNAQFNNASNAYLGLSFASGANLYYGWVRVSVNQAAGTFIVHDWAYENSGAGIAAGAVPAPGALGLFAAGASGLGFLRGRKRAS